MSSLQEATRRATAVRHRPAEQSHQCHLALTHVQLKMKEICFVFFLLRNN